MFDVLTLIATMALAFPFIIPTIGGIVTLLSPSTWREFHQRREENRKYAEMDAKRNWWWDVGFDRMHAEITRRSFGRTQWPPGYDDGMDYWCKVMRHRCGKSLWR
jgi:hypothetical protein